MEEQLREAQHRAPQLPLAGLALESDWAFLATSQDGLTVLDRVLSEP
jgi:hypothetical protein